MSNHTYWWVWKVIPEEKFTDPFLQYYNKYGTSPLFVKIGEDVNIPLPSDVIILDEKPKVGTEIWMRHDNF